MTVALWVKTTKTGIQAMVSGANAGNDAEFELVLLSNPDLQLRFYTGETNETHVVWPVPGFADGAWHHLAVTRDAANDEATLYLDGVSQGALGAVFDPLTIDPMGLLLGQEQDRVGGGFDPTQAFQGSMDEVRLYTRVLSAAEIADLAEADTTPPDPPTGLSATAGDGEVSLDWDDNLEPDRASYSVYRSGTMGGPYIELDSGLTVSDYVDAAVVNGNTYFYAVTATDTSDNESVTSLEVSATPFDAYPFAFTDVTDTSGVGGPLDNSYVHAAAWGDVDGNGYPDLFAGTFVRGRPSFPTSCCSTTRGAFTDAGQAPVEISGRAAGALLVDLDGDGDSDLFVSNNRKPGGAGPIDEPSHLYRNDGGVFTDVTAGSGIDAQSALGRQAGVLDFDGDGLLDLFVVADSFAGGGPTVLLRNEGNLEFSDATAAAGIPAGVHGLGLAIGDVTGNGWPDIFVAGGNDLTQPNTNYLFLANGDGTYRTASSSALSWAPFTTGNEDWVSGGAFADLNRDGRLDLLVGHHFGTASETGPGVPIRVYMNRGLDGSGDPIFEDITAAIGLPPIDSKAPHVDIQDFDNDGWPDLYVSVTVDSAQRHPGAVRSRCRDRGRGAHRRDRRRSGGGRGGLEGRAHARCAHGRLHRRAHRSTRPAHGPRRGHHQRLRRDRGGQDQRPGGGRHPRRGVTHAHPADAHRGRHPARLSIATQRVEPAAPPPRTAAGQQRCLRFIAQARPGRPARLLDELHQHAVAGARVQEGHRALRPTTRLPCR